jgi:aspartyl-tRNA(Asn)/glutamyl-tRNA(Gln) amidotransferase subunit C
MQIDKDTVSKMAHLARLDFDASEEAEMMKSMSTILNWMEKLNELDTNGVEPLIHLSAELNVFRNDEAKEPLSHERGLRNAPRKDSDYFRVPKVIE